MFYYPLIIHHDLGNASHLLKCENTNKLKSVKGEKNCFIVGNDPVRLDNKCVLHTNKLHNLQNRIISESSFHCYRQV